MIFNQNSLVRQPNFVFLHSHILSTTIKLMNINTRFNKNSYFVIILILCNSLFCLAQQDIKLPDILPPSPSAFALTRYGGISLGLQTGTAQYSIPLYKLISGRLSLPINLSYSSNGIKVDEIASRVGMSFILNSGGVITRTVYDQPDLTSTRILPPADFTHTTALYSFLDKASNSDRLGVDVAPDFYSFNFDGHSGQFIIDGNNTVQLTKTNLKIEFNQTGDSNFGGEFRITTPAGIVYYFGGGPNSIESSSSFATGENCGRARSTPVKNAWYLTKIVNPEGESISLLYDALPSYSYPVSTYQTRTKSYQVQGCSGQNSVIDDVNCENFITTNSVYLTKITTSKNNYVEFKYTARQDLPYDKLVESINVYGGDNLSCLKSFSFKYDYSTGNSFGNQYSSSNPTLKFRPFLTSVTESSIASNEKALFAFDYENISSLPPRLSFAQDDYGYFNGKSNSNLLPQQNLFFSQYFTDANADRKSSYEFAKLGMLKKIKYPTGGYDSIAYKAPVYTTMELPDPDPKTSSASAVGKNLSGQVSVTSEPFTITTSQYAKIGGSFLFTGTPDQEDFHAQSYIYLINTTTGQTVFSYLLNSENPQRIEIVSLSPGQTYVVKCTSYGQYSNGSVVLNYFSQGTVPVQKNKITGGVVVDFVRTHDPVKKTDQLKKYYYSPLNNLAISSGSELISPIYMKDYSTMLSCVVYKEGLAPGAVQEFPCGMMFNFQQLSSNSLTNLYSYSQHHIYFSNVVEGFGSNFENGGIEHTFTVEPNTPGEVKMGNDILGSTLSNRGSGKNGLEILTNMFKKKGSSFVSVKQVKTTYKTDDRLTETFYGYTVRKRYNPTCTYTPPSSDQFNAFDVNKNYIYSRWTYIDTIVTTSFDEAGLNKLSQTEVFNYGNLVHLLPTERRISTSSGNLITQYKYPYDFASIAPYNTMHNTLHIWSPVVEQLEYRYDAPSNTTTFLRSTKTDYQIWNGNNSQIYPVTISTKLGAGNYKSEIQFFGYDKYGNVQCVSKANGPKISYVYGYGGTYPVAEIKNADFTTITTVLGGITSLTSFVDNLNPSETVVRNFLAPLRTHSSLINSLVVSLTFKPQIGMASMTDAKGKTTYYEYDNFQRLQNVKDQDGNIIKNYDYHYKP